MIRSIFLTLCITAIPVFIFAQQDTGIHFIVASNWKDVLDRAKAENKNIFVDFYATWCAPCEQMDREIYVRENVGLIAEKHFISIKIQVDQTPGDKELVKSWYKEAENFSKIYHIQTLPSLVCFSADGKLMSKDDGYRTAEELLAILNNVISSKDGYSVLVERYQAHQLTPEYLGELAKKAKKMGDSKLADTIAADYKRAYLDKLSDSELLTKENMEFVRNFPVILNGNDRIFRFFYTEPEKADKIIALDKTPSGTVMKSSREIAKDIITKEEINDLLYQKGKPVTLEADWKTIYRGIKGKYGKLYANEVIMPAKLRYYRAISNWKQYAALINAAIKKYPPQINGHTFSNVTMTGFFFQRDDWNLNSSAWDIFEHCNEKKLLKEALTWSELSIKISGNENGMDAIDQYHDTKANLLYKLGFINEALAIETKIYNRIVENALKQGVPSGGEGILGTINKMKAGQPTWLAPVSADAKNN